jgi:membrane fusion protein (multidrug efflux system)
MAMISAALMVGACGKGGETATKPGAGSGGPPPVNVVLMRAKAMELQRSVRITGNLVGLETPTISNRVTGRVTKVLVDRGDRVQPGQTLLEIEPDRFRMSVDESQAALAQTLARLGVKEVPGENFDVNQTAPVKKAKSQYDLAKEKMDRTTPLHDAQRINDFEYLAVVSDFRSAESTLENSRDEARALLAQARQNRAALEMRQKDFADSVIMAPDGSTPEKIQIDSYVVNDRKVSPGEYVREGTALFTLIADRILKLQARVPERYLGDVKEGAKVTFQVEAYPDEEFAGKVTVIHPAIDEASRTFMVEAQVDNTQYSGRLRPGSFVPGEVLTKKEAGRVMVPLDALTSFVGVTKLFKLDLKANPPKVKSVDVTQGQQEAVTDASGKVTQWVEIVKGDVTADDQVVISGMTKLVDGSAVKIAADEKKPEAAPPEARK